MELKVSPTATATSPISVARIHSMELKVNPVYEDLAIVIHAKESIQWN